MWLVIVNFIPDTLEIPFNLADVGLSSASIFDVWAGDDLQTRNTRWETYYFDSWVWYFLDLIQLGLLTSVWSFQPLGMVYNCWNSLRWPNSHLYNTCITQPLGPIVISTAPPPNEPLERVWMSLGTLERDHISNGTISMAEITVVESMWPLITSWLIVS